MKKRKLLLLIIPFILSSCGGGEQPPFDDDKDDDDSTIIGGDDGGMFDDDDEDDAFIPTLKDDTNSNYVFEDVDNKGGATYEIFVRSFYDSDGDGIGDLNGVTQKLDYLKDLGVENIWLMPFNESPSYHGYDVEDYYSIEKDYGTLDDFKKLNEKAESLGINIYMDLVINHSSSTNAWFEQSAMDYYTNNTSANSKKDWYCWSDTGGSNRHEYKGMGFYYEGDFSSSMPDFNLDCEAVRNELANVIKYWLDLGVDGFRLDAVLYYYQSNVSKNIEFLNWIKDTAESVKKDTYIVGEAWVSNQSGINEYYRSKVDSFFNFPSSLNGSGNDSINSVVKGFTNANLFGSSIESKEKSQKENNPKGRSSYFLANHDMDRSSQNLTGDLAKAASSLMILLPGNPYMYYGEEIELKGKRTSNSTDAERRLPMIWSKDDKTGECDVPDCASLGSNYNPDQVELGVDDQLKNGYSLVNHYKKAINLRNKYNFIQDAIFENLTVSIASQDDHVLLYKLTNGDDSIIVCHNFNDSARQVEIGDISTEILDSINTTKKIPELNAGKLSLGGYSTVILNVK